MSLLSTVPVLADPAPEDVPVAGWTVARELDRIEHEAPRCDAPLADGPCVEWSYHRFLGVPQEWTFESLRSHDEETIYMGLNAIPDPQITGGSGRPLTVAAVNASTGHEEWLATIDPFGRPVVTDMVLSDDGSFLAFSSYLQDNNTCAAYAVDTATGDELWSHIAPDHYRCRGIDIAPDGSKVYLVGETRQVSSRLHPFFHVLDSSDGSLLSQSSWQVDHQTHDDILVLADGSVTLTGRVTLAGPGGDSIYLARFVNGALDWEVRIPATTNDRSSDVRQPVLSQDGSLIYFGASHSVAAADPVTGALEWVHGLYEEVDLSLPDLALSPAGDLLVVPFERHFVVLDADTGTVSWEHHADYVSRLRDVVFSDDGELHVLYGDDPTVDTHDAATGEHLERIGVPWGRNSRLFLTDDGFLVSSVDRLPEQGVHLDSVVA